MTRTDGKTFADVLDSVLSNWKRFLSFLTVTACFFILLLLTTWAVTRVLGVTSASQISLSTTGAQILFESKSSDSEQYLMIVHPQGWQDSGITVKNGDRIEFKAGGSITIDVNGIIDRAKQRYEFEAKYVKEKNLNKTSEDPNMAPETYFDAEEKEALRLRRPWVGPDGYEVSQSNQSYASRRNRWLLPNEHIGALVACIKDSGEKSPARAQTFVVGAEKTKAAEREGRLWFSVNDVLNESDPLNTDLFYADNIGFYWVKIIVDHKGRQ